MPLDPNQIAFAKEILHTLRQHHGAGNAHTTYTILTVVELIESRAPESELSSSSPAAVTPESCLGDHLYVTRKHFGFTA